MATERLNILPGRANFALLALGMLAIFAVLFSALSNGQVRPRYGANIEDIIISTPWAVTANLDAVPDEAKTKISLPYVEFDGDEQSHIHFEAAPTW